MCRSLLTNSRGDFVMGEKTIMPDDCVPQPHHDNEGMDAQSMHGYQSVWMAHWMHTSYKSATQARHHLSLDCESKTEVKMDTDAEHHNLLGGPDGAIDISTNSGAFKGATKATAITFLNENLTASPGKSKEKGLNFKSFPIFSLSQKTDGILSLKREQYAIYRGEVVKSEADASYEDNNVSFNTTGSHLPSKSVYVPPRKETLSRKCHLKTEGFLPADLLMKTPDGIEKWNNFVKSTSDIVPYGDNQVITAMPSFTCEQREIHQSREHFTGTNYHSYSSVLIREQKMSSLLEDPMQSGSAHLPHNQLAGSNDGPDCVPDQVQKMQNYSDTAKFLSQTGPLESTKSGKFYCGSSSLPQLPCSVTIDSLEDSSRGHPKISQTSHQFLMSKSTDVNLSDRDKFFGEFIRPTKFEGNASNEIPYCAAPMESGCKENVQDFKAPTSLKNESSAETDTMDIKSLQENHLPGDIPLPSSKCPKDCESSPTFQVGITSAREKTKANVVNTAVPDINQEPPQFPALTSPVDDRETSISRTQSLDVEHLLSHGEEHENSKSSPCDDDSWGPEPSSRWIKRLKLSTSLTAHGTKSTRIGEPSSREKINKIFSKIMNGSKTCSEPKSICHAEEQMVPNLPATISTNDKSSFVKAKQTVEVTLSHPWIQRWSHNCAASSQNKHESVELRQPQYSNTVLEKFQKKQFPSIAAMALMGKAVGSMRPCEFMKKGSMVVWNTGNSESVGHL